MRFLTFGDKSHEAAVLIHGMASTAEACFGPVARALAERYYVILPMLAGHDPLEEGTFGTVKDAAAEIERYIAGETNGRLALLLGFSLGGTIALDILARGNLSVRLTVLDGTLCSPMGIMTSVFSNIFASQIDRLQRGKRIPGLFMSFMGGKGNSGIMDSLYLGVSRKTILHACESVYRYSVPSRVAETASAVSFWYGSKETFPKISAELLRRYLPDMNERRFAGMGHGQYLLMHPQEYARDILKEIVETVSLDAEGS